MSRFNGKRAEFEASGEKINIDPRFLVTNFVVDVRAMG